MKIVFIGSGNLATQLGKAISSKKGFEIVQIYSRTLQNAQSLAELVGAQAINDVDKIIKDADLYIFALKDSSMAEVIARMPKTSGVWVHTSGSMPMDVFTPYVEDYGVFYPMQTFSKTRDVDFGKVYFYLESATPKAAMTVKEVAHALSTHIVQMSSEDRRKLHLAAVFACNFTNHMYVMANKILGNNESFTCGLIPLIDETAAKIHDMTPKAAQTGPAIRYDENVISRHMAMIDDPTLREIYRLMSESIHKEAQDE